MADIFLSYASPEDVDRVKPLVDALQAEGWTTWWDRDLVTGPSFNERIEAALNGARCVLVVWSEHSIKSRWCQDEANEGLERGVLVPVLIDDVRPPLGFRSSQTASLIGWPEKGGELANLLAGLHECLGTAPINAAPLPTSGKLGIAVLPFANVSNDPDQEFFCDGISEELINALVALGNVDVIARSSSFQFKNRNEDVRKVASALGVSHVLEGSVRKVEGRVRVTAELIEGRNGTHVWSNRYDRHLTDIFAVQDEITAAIMQALARELGAGSQNLSRGGTKNPLAYDAYLRATYELAASPMHVPRAKRALPYVEEALTLDPEFADAWGVLADVQFSLGYQIPDLDQLHHSIERALELDPGQCVALRVQAFTRAFEHYDAQGALDALATLIRQRPSDYGALSAFVWLASGWHGSYQNVDTVQLCSRMIELDPLREIGYRFRANTYLRLGRYEPFLADAQRALELAPDDLHTLERMIVYAREKGDQSALEDSLRQYRTAVGPASFLAEAFEAKDRTVTLERLKARERSGGNIRILDAARAYAYLEDHEAAIAKYREFVDASRSFQRFLYTRDHLLQPLMRYPEYQEILATIGSDDATLARIQVPSVI